MSRDGTGNTTGDYLSGTAPAAAASYPWTVAAWVYLADAPSATNCMWKIKVAATPDRYHKVVFLTTGVCRGTTQLGASAYCDTTNTANYAAWNSIIYIGASATERTIVLNGDWANGATNTTSKTPTPDTTDFFVDLNVGQTADAMMAHWAMWDYAWGQARCELWHRGVSPFLIPGTTVKAYYPMWGKGTTEPQWGTQDGGTLSVTGTIPVSANNPAVRMFRQPTLVLPASAAPGGLSIPVAMHSYRQRRIA